MNTPALARYQRALRPVVCISLLFALLATGGRAATTPDGAWEITAWWGERAYMSTSHGWTAIVLTTRGRLIHFAPANNPDANLLLATVHRNDPAGWSGHKLRLGPKSAWAGFWQPPIEWESTAPESVTLEGDVLRIKLADAGDGWPQLTRTYHWDGARLVCGAEMRGGRRPAQFMHALDMPATTLVEVPAQRESGVPKGYVLLPIENESPLQSKFSRPANVKRSGKNLIFGLKEKPLRPAFRPQALVARVGQHTMTVSRGAQTGKVVDQPDRGFFTQVYISSYRQMLMEISQHSPLFSPDEPASFAITLEGGGPP